MVKSSFIVASVATIACVVSAQELPTAIPSGIPTALPSGINLPSGAIPTDVAGAVSSIMGNPDGIQSYISMASGKVGSLPSQYQASAYSALSEASKTLASIQPKNTNSAHAKTTGDSNTMYRPSAYLAAFVISVAVVVGVI
ncbi:hypothetical protein BDF21DRAFT_497498 [Thamnidium elegans]|nr:hypothetical protein BDF21DRAFT_497498 [Thamnidium elegans]